MVTPKLHEPFMLSIKYTFSVIMQINKIKMNSNKIVIFLEDKE